MSFLSSARAVFASTKAKAAAGFDRTCEAIDNNPEVVTAAGVVVAVGGFAWLAHQASKSREVLILVLEPIKDAA